MLLISVHMHNPFLMFPSLSMTDTGMDFNPKGAVSNPTQSQDALRQYMENENCAKHCRVLVYKHESLQSSNFIPSVMASGFCQSSFDSFDCSSNDEQYAMPNNVAGTTP
jgi:hypothetical protein